MIIAASLLIAQSATASLPAPVRPRPRPVNALTVSATVEVVRAERIGGLAAPDALLRQIRRDPRGVMVEFD